MAETVPVEHQIVVRSLLGQAYGGATAFRLAAATREMFFPAGKVIYEAGDRAKYVHFIVQGCVELEAEGLEPWSFKDRGVFGILDAELERPHTRTARAATDVRVIAIRAEDWQDIVEDTFDYTRMRFARNAQDLLRRGLELAPHAGFEGVPVAHRADELPPVASRDQDDPFQRLLVLHLADIFKRASIQALTRLATSARAIEVAAEGVLISEGDVADELFIVSNGLFKMSRVDPALSASFGVNRLIGGYAGLGQETWPVTVRAVELSHVIAIGYEDLFDVMEDHFDVVRSAMGFLAVERERLQALKW